MREGYSSHWLIILYIIGGYLGKYIIINKNYKNFKYFIICFLIYIFSAFITSESFFILNNTTFYNKYILFIVIYQFGLILYIFLGLIDYLRSIFFKILKIKQFCLFIEDKFSKLMDKYN